MLSSRKNALEVRGYQCVLYVLVPWNEHLYSFLNPVEIALFWMHSQWHTLVILFCSLS